MSIKPVHFNGLMQRSQDVSSIKQNEEQKSVVQQNNIQTSFAKKSESLVKNVNQAKEKQDANGHFDAKEEGKNKYFSQRKKNQSEELIKDQVRKKNVSSGFDVTV